MSDLDSRSGISDAAGRPFVPRHVSRTHRIDLPLPADRAFHFFTPAGEREWVPDWDPVFLHPADGSLETGGAFVTDPASEESRTLWLVTHVDADNRRVSYARVTPASRIGLVDVRVTAAGPTASHVQVTYSFTALTESGNAYLEAFTGPYFRTYIDTWRELILAHLERRKAQ